MELISLQLVFEKLMSPIIYFIELIFKAVEKYEVWNFNDKGFFQMGCLLQTPN